MQQGYPVQQQQGYPAQQPYPPQGYVQPGYAAQPYTTPYGPYAAPPRRRRPSRGLMIAGLSVLGGSYLIATAVGASLMDEDDVDDGFDDCRSCKDVGPWLFLPVAGPFIAMSQTSSGDGALWFLGMVEAVGLGLTIGGIILYKNSKREIDGAALSWNLPHDRKLSLDVSTSSRMAGPQLKLRF